MPTPMDEKTLEQVSQLESETPELIDEVFRIFVNDAPRHLRVIAAAQASGNLEAAQQAAHFLRSGALVMGLADLAQKAGDVEHLTPEQFGGEQAGALVVELRKELHRVLLTLLRKLKSG